MAEEVEQPVQGPIFAGSVGTEFIQPPPPPPQPQADPRTAPDGTSIPDNTGATLVSQDPAPAIVEPPEVIDTPLAYQDGALLICTKGNWHHVPTDYAYTWNSGGAPVGGNNDTYEVTPEMVGYTFTCTVKATNAGGSTMVTSNEVVVVEPPAAAV